MIESVSACGCSYTAVSTATRGRVTRSAAPRNNCSKSKVVDTSEVWPIFWNQSRTQAAAFDLAFSPGRRNVTGLAATSVGLRRIGVDRSGDHTCRDLHPNVRLKVSHSYAVMRIPSTHATSADRHRPVVLTVPVAERQLKQLETLAGRRPARPAGKGSACETVRLLP